MPVEPGAIQAILTHARADYPREACGLLMGQDGSIAEARPATNVHPSPETHFEIDPAALVAAHRAAREGGPQVMGYYHSHPTGPATPSAIDRALAAHDGSVWAIAGEGAVTFWLDGEIGFAPLPYRVTDG